MSLTVGTSQYMKLELTLLLLLLHTFMGPFLVFLQVCLLIIMIIPYLCYLVDVEG